MAYRKRKQSAEVDKANKRFDGLMSIVPEVELGPDLTLTLYRGKITEVENRTKSHNTLLTDLDTSLTLLEKSEKELADYSERMLSGVGSKYGFDSIEYEKAGGVRKSEIKRSTRKKKK
jgi:hypothetical protein